MNDIPGKTYLPEGFSEKKQKAYDIETLMEAMSSGRILEGLVTRCDAYKNLFVSLGRYSCIIPANETAIGASEGKTKDIAIISLVGKFVSFKVIAVNLKSSPPSVLLSRRLAQEEAMEYFMESLRPGSVLKGIVTHLANFGAFVDIGCGIISMIGIENISVARIFHPLERFHTGQKILAAVLSVDKEARRLTLTHKELLGTWLENAESFSTGDTVTGIVRGVKPYGLFIELKPNLSGLSEYSANYPEGETVSVYIKSVTPEKMKIKLAVVGKVNGHPGIMPYEYKIRGGVISRWVYSPENCQKLVETSFENPQS